MKVQIIIPAINLWAKYTRPAISSIDMAMVRADGHGVKTRILLIDNASTDETREEAGKLVSEVFSHKRNEERWGFQKSVNFGVNDAWERGFDYAFVVNNDIVLHPEAIWRLAEAFERSRALDGVELPTAMLTCMDVRGETEPDKLADIVAIEKEDVEESPHPNFSAFMIDKRCWEEVGEFDEAFAPAYFEDNDYHYRIKLAGMAAWVHPPAMFYHYGSRTTNEAGENGKQVVTGRQFEQNIATYLGKWGGKPGEEAYETPYKSDTLTLRSTKQKP